jgi:hypothetical protein
MWNREIALGCLQGLLAEFRQGNIYNAPAAREALERHLREISREWDRRFPGFPEPRYPYSSLRGTYQRGARDRYLRRIILSLLDGEKRTWVGGTVVNPACVYGRHARFLASRLESLKVLGMDINQNYSRFLSWTLLRRSPKNYEFRLDNIFEPAVRLSPVAVVFFGACGSVSDAAMDYAIDTRSPYLVCRTCCHDNIGGNTEIERRSTPLNWSFRLKNFVYTRKRQQGTGEYFSPKYSRDHYPRSETARSASSTDEFMDICQSSVDSDLCRAIIDLDRCLRLQEKGYEVWYRGELFVAQRGEGSA